MTLGVKNTFGFIHALEKAKWHLRAGRNRSLFASILIDIHTIASPSITVLDGVVGMDGDGPSSGRPRNLGLLGVSRNAFALDACIEKILGLAHPMPITDLAGRHGMLPQYEVVDHGIPGIEGFMLPKTMETDWNIPVFAKRLLRTALLRKPRLIKKACKGCGVCAHVCPGNALSISKGRPVFNYEQCIRCFCCQEMCPEGAIKV